MNRISQTVGTALLFLSLNHLSSSAIAQGTAFTYQGQLQNNGVPASGMYNLQFTLYTNSVNGNVAAGPFTTNGVAIANGLFTVAMDFGSGVWNGETNWLQIGVESNGLNGFTALSPRQPLTPVPYAITAQNLTGSVGLTQLPPGVVTNNEGNVTLSTLVLSSNLDLPATTSTSGVIYSGANTILDAYGFANFFAGLNAGNLTNTSSDDTGIGQGALGSISGSADDTAVGAGALALNTSGTGNTAVGVVALISNTTGGFNTAIGMQTLHNNISGSYNVAIGQQSLYSNTTGSENVAAGDSALLNNVDGAGNMAAGASALQNNTHGSWNTAIGENALENDTTGSNNIAFGYQAGYNITGSSSNIDIGNEGTAADTNVIRIGSTQSQTFIAGTINGDGGGLTNLNVGSAQITSIGNGSGGNSNFFVGPSGNSTMTGSANTGIGTGALDENTSGYENTAAGADALYYNTSGSGNTASGYYALLANTIGSQNTADGVDALGENTNGSGNTANGNGALGNNTSGSYNTADGVQALVLNTTGSNNIALGYSAGQNITTGSGNIEIGNVGVATDTNIIRIGSGQSQTYITGTINGNGGGLTNLNSALLVSPGNTNNGASGNFFVGQAGNSTMVGSANTAIGFIALIANVGGFGNTASGTDALGSNTNGSNNTADGASALYENTSGGANTADGCQALMFNTNGIFDTASGYDALYVNGSGSFNTAVGTYGLVSNTIGSYNIGLGYEAGYDITTGGTNIDIGNVGVSTDTNIIRIGSTQAATYLAGNLYVAGAVFSNGVDVVSDRNAKENFNPVNPQTVLARIAAMPVTEWNYKTDRSVEHIGPMAQDFHAAFGLNGPDDKHISVLDEGGVALAAIKGLNQKLETDNSELRQENDLLAKRLDELEGEVRAMRQSGQ